MAADPVVGNIGEEECTASPFPEENNLRVLEVIPGNGCGAGFLFARRQVASLAKAGVNVRSFYLSRGSPLVWVREWNRLRHEIRQFRPSLVHAHYGSLTAFLCALASTVPLIVTLRGCDLNEDPEVSALHIGLAHILSQIACLRARRVIIVNEQLRSRMWSHRRDAAVIPSGVDLHLFHPIPKEKARSTLGWQQYVPTVLFHGGGRPRLKGADIVEAAVQAAEHIVGPIRLMDMDGQVPFELVPYWINAADCVALASVSEGSPNIVKEALACNVPVVATDVGDVAERLRDVQPSRVVSRDVAEFASALAGILQQPCASNGREKVSVLDESRVAQAVRAVYFSALQSRIPA